VTPVRFPWSPLLVEIRREVCPAARWQRLGRQWIMSETDAQAFLRAAQARLDYRRTHTQISVGDTIWIVGFVRGAPYQLPRHTAA
jgi:hypothetical protein